MVDEGGEGNLHDSVLQLLHGGCCGYGLSAFRIQKIEGSEIITGLEIGFQLVVSVWRELPDEVCSYLLCYFLCISVCGLEKHRKLRIILSYGLSQLLSSFILSPGGREGQVCDYSQDILPILSVEIPGFAVVPGKKDLRPSPHPQLHPPFVQGLKD